jgi:hypothetical protein
MILGNVMIGLKAGVCILMTLCPGFVKTDIGSGCSIQDFCLRQKRCYTERKESALCCREFAQESRGSDVAALCPDCKIKTKKKRNLCR